MSALQSIFSWLFGNADGDWEHMYGFTLQSEDTSGYHLKIDLHETEKEGLIFDIKHDFSNIWPAWPTEPDASYRWIKNDSTTQQINIFFDSFSAELVLTEVAKFLNPTDNEKSAVD